ncbi:MAG: hypothetical protein ACE5GU_03230 [Candidatus Scalinduaceae bacterium]
MEKSPFEQFILENLYNVWKEHGTHKVKTFQALIEEYGFKEKNINKPMKRLISEGFVDTDPYCAWITKKGITQMALFDKSAVTPEDKVSVSDEINFLKNLEQEISKSELTMLEREMWLNGIKELSHNPVLLKAVKAALKSTTDRKPS